MIILDTNVISALMMVEPDPAAAAWLDLQPRFSIWTSAISIFEIRFGLHAMADGRNKTRREAEFETLLRNDLQGRILSFDQAAAEAAGALMANRNRIGRAGEWRDTMIAGIALAQNAALATRNVRHFDDLSVPVINPWRA
jgi:predicted nucleic acid-binding protein